ncbi:hypothetical protein Lal_00032027 [Lupinus albus]|nr:hypothetical protein Lal_00032027 [Lupinus albus]
MVSIMKKMVFLEKKVKKTVKVHLIWFSSLCKYLDFFDSLAYNIPSNHLKVSIDIPIEDDALLPILVDEDIITVRQAIGTFVAWPENLIDVVPIMNSPVDSTIIISIPEPIYGFSTDEFIDINEVKDVHDLDWIDASAISMYIRFSLERESLAQARKSEFLPGFYLEISLEREEARLGETWLTMGVKTGRY